MRFNCGRRLGERIDALLDKISTNEKEWHSWFSWWPRRLDDEKGKEVCVWLETIQRRVRTVYGKYLNYDVTEYRLNPRCQERPSSRT